MHFEVVNGLSLPKIGLGTWRIGGGSSANPARDATDLAALRSALALGYTHFDTAELYAAGHAEELVGRALREAGIQRESVFLTSKAKAEHLRFDDVLRACDSSLRRLGVDYLDLYLIHWPNSSVRLEETFRALNKLVEGGKVYHLGVSNFSLKLLQRSQALSETPLLTNQVPYSITDRSYVKNGILAYCQANGIALTAYSPFDQGHMRVKKDLAAIAEARNVTPHQIALAWLTTQPLVITIPMSTDSRHQRENLGASDIVLDEQEMNQLTALSQA